MGVFKIVNKQILSKNIKRLEILAENTAGKILPGQFVNIITHEKEKGIPLAVIDTDPRKGTISLILKEMGRGTGLLGEMPIGDSVFSIMGPLGNPASIENVGTVLCVSTDLWVASMFPICKAYKNAGNNVVGVIAVNSKKDLMLETQMRLSCRKLYISTRDGSYERKGKASDLVREIVGTQDIDLVYAIGSVEMMKDVSRIAVEKSIKVLVQLNSNIVCGSGICGSCRVSVDSETVLACQHGPEFDGSKVNYDLLKLRGHVCEEGLDDLDKKEDDLEAKATAKFFPGHLKDK